MCGRYALRSSVPELARTLGVEPPVDFAPRYNIAPTQMVPAMHAGQGSRTLHWMRWGLVPGWSKGVDARYAMHNARIEGIATKPAYRGPVRRRRCLLPVSGWYEWQKQQDRKQAWFISHRERSIVCLAGLWDEWQHDGKSIISCSILTGPAATPIDAVHHRMPIVLAADYWDAWLDPDNTDASSALDILQPLHADGLQTVAVSTHVNNARNDDPRCLEGLEPAD